jgi:hypothetical protein
MIAPAIAVLKPPPNSPITNPASSQTRRKSAIRMMLFRLLWAIW